MSGPGETHGTVYLERLSMEKLEAICPDVSKGIGGRDMQSRMNKLIGRLEKVRQMRQENQVIKEWNFALVKSTPEGREVTARRQIMTEKLARLKNRTLKGKNMQWCRIGY
jgi:hypothetical protein